MKATGRRKTSESALKLVDVVSDKGQANARRRFSLPSQILIIIIVGMLLVPLGSTAPLHFDDLQASDIPERVTTSSAGLNDTATTLHLQTDWNSQVEIPEEIRVHNMTESGKQQPDIPTEMAPFIPGKSVKNKSRVFETNNDLGIGFTGSATRAYFGGHTWSWEYGTDDRHIRASEVTRPLEGNWFPKTGYSRITYQAAACTGIKIHFRVERGADTYGRRIRLYCSQYLLLDDIINSWEDYYEAVVPTNVPMGSYFITLEIHWGGHKDRGWSLRHWQMTSVDGEDYDQPMRTSYQQFQKERSSILEFRVPMGPGTVLNIETENCHDFYYRYLYVYVDGTLKKTLYAPGAYEVEIADFASPGIHDLKLKLYYGDHFWGSYSKSIKQLYVTYEYRHVEVDSMSGHAQPQWVYDYAEAYYNTHDYRRVEFHPGQTNIPHDDVISESDWIALYNTYASSTCKSSNKWTWGLFCHRFYSTAYQMYVWGLGEVGGRKFVIADDASDDNGRNWILMHEYGHTEYMTDHTGYKDDIYTESQYGYAYVDWVTPHYMSSSWTDHLWWVVGWW